MDKDIIINTITKVAVIQVGKNTYSQTFFPHLKYNINY